MLLDVGACFLVSSLKMTQKSAGMDYFLMNNCNNIIYAV